MSRHPRSTIIMQYGGLVIDCDSIDHIAVVEPTKEDHHYYVSISFRSSPKIARLRAVDGEQAYIILARLKRGMIAAMCGDNYILDECTPSDHGDNDDDPELPKPTEQQPPPDPDRPSDPKEPRTDEPQS